MRGLICVVSLMRLEKFQRLYVQVLDDKIHICSSNQEFHRSVSVPGRDEAQFKHGFQSSMIRMDEENPSGLTSDVRREV